MMKKNKLILKKLPIVLRKLIFDYLRHHMRKSNSERLFPAMDNYIKPGKGKSFCVAVIDEVDLLIEHSLVPLIISLASINQDIKSDVYYKIDKVIKRFVKGEDYICDVTNRKVYFTQKGMIYMEDELQKSGILSCSLVDRNGLNYYHACCNSLHANYMMLRNEHYIVSNKKVVLVDVEGRKQHGREYVAGLQRSIEAKEGLPIGQENDGKISISYPMFFSLL